MKVKRPQDLDLLNIIHCTNHLSPREISARTGGLVSAATIRNWRKQKVRTPLNYTLSAALAAVGYERVIRKIRNVRD